MITMNSIKIKSGEIDYDLKKNDNIKILNFHFKLTKLYYKI